ncbi:RNA-directed DNA polymerase [Mycoplasmatota bacterium]|nr:RNA-directed DNA polymerase [Mycoplasmatota bacterium]
MENKNLYRKKIENSDISFNEKQKLLSNLGNIKDDYPIILNGYHISNKVGIKWNDYLKLLKNTNKYYHVYYMAKKSGGRRKITIPDQILMDIQYFIKNNILENIKIDESAFGFRKQKSILANATYHREGEKVLIMDIENFFPSIHKGRVYYVFNKICGYSREVSYDLTRLVTYNNGLPQGAPTSPIISNIVAYKLDLRLKGLSYVIGIKYSRYADDLTFSGAENKINDKLLYTVSNIIEDEGFKLNLKKIRFYGKNSTKIINGLVINNGYVTIQKRYIDKIKQELYYIRKFGLESHLNYVGFKNKHYAEHLKGKILYVYSIDKEKGKQLFSLYNELNIENKPNLVRGGFDEMPVL